MGGRTPAYGGQTPARSERHSSGISFFLELKVFANLPRFHLVQEFFIILESPDSSDDEEQHERREMEYESPASPMYSAPTPGSMNPLTPAAFDAPPSNYNTPMSPSNYYSAPTPFANNDYDNAIRILFLVACRFDFSSKLFGWRRMAGGRSCGTNQEFA